MTRTLRRAGLAVAVWAFAGCAASAPVDSTPAETAAPSETGSLVVLPVTAQPVREPPPPVEPGPRKAKSAASLSDSEIVLPAAIEFETAKAIIQPASHDTLLSLVDLMAAHPEILSIEVGVHSDSRGGSEFNLALTQARAESVRTFLVENGLAEARLTAVGFGETRPKSADQNANRRVEILVKRTR